MQVDLSNPQFQAAVPILRRIEDAGFEAYFVGGCVRDALLGLPIHDVDIATSAYPAEVKGIFRRTVDTGIQHGTVTVLDHGAGYEVTTFRTESGYQDFRRPDSVQFVRSLKEDQLRRDFTVNALAARHDGTVIDNFDGLTDLHNHVLRAVGRPDDRFGEDALRMMRAVRFQSQLGFALEPATAQGISDNAPLLQHIAVERIASEFTRLLLGIDRRAGLQTLIDTDLYRYCPQLADARAALNHLAALPDTQLQDPAVAWTLMVVLVGAPVNRFLRAWKQSNDLIATVSAAAAIWPLLGDTIPDHWALYTAGRTGLRIALEAYVHVHPDFNSTPVQAAYDALAIHDKGELALTGSDLIQAGMQPGRAMGQALRRAEEAVVAGSVPNTKNALLAYVRV
ncbi:tRNA nucleotidyltransferase poly(A) polymerase [Lacticaseibacillus pantheris DSM 15945 = JCM 12539 = NBRC 106106]|uniref:CCA-adding enzyme n=1 Tax=Lacticaseibacillus pantheris DSM 15945 = JCM 12539 = NBRC 106106 TaxID=1423783 RepID=A0A0R1TWC8_9LACO|nr:CCA tRNA nucleotidyltransferase [Lacticaseibacillus pantheris]KRL85510.1 tRNA nucleotidyltransferase poly(A) polymerase [Lacticaseibacillus pantheris DSM 15945 = JCM 12539 = NBRC 106106]